MSLKNNSAVSAPWRPIFSNTRPRSKPGVSASTANSAIPLCPASTSVLATTTTKSAEPPLEMKVLEPLMM